MAGENTRQIKSRLRFESILEELSKSNLEVAEEIGFKKNSELDIEQSLLKDNSVIVKGVSAILVGAVENGATDIHIEGYENILRIRFRIDGELREIKQMSVSILNSLVSRIKVMSNLNIAERRLPQDGRMKLKILGRDIDFRISIVPAIYGEKVSIRLLDKTMVDMNLEKIGFTKAEYEKIVHNINLPHGIILVTGPTGSGKSTTLYSILNFLNKPNVNISTVEDPVEYNIDGVNQIQTKNEIGYDFGIILKAILRQDPDIIMIGEVRDNETAEIAIKAALTGHLVLSTLHTNTAPSSVTRLMNMGIEKFLISATLRMVISQRLLRRLCSKCKIIDETAEEKLILLGLHNEKYKDKIFYRNSTSDFECLECKGGGYKGRISVHEIFAMNDKLRASVEIGAIQKNIEDLAIESGMLQLKEDGILKALEGLTSLEEVVRNCQ
ncbi:MAG: GspE/PulE family protein [Fusobacteriaceae bacterium]